MPLNLVGPYYFHGPYGSVMGKSGTNSQENVFSIPGFLVTDEDHSNFVTWFL